MPAGTRLYAIGDIHGRLDLLRLLHAQIVEDAQDFGGEKTIVYLGDYIDRGLESRGVIELLARGPLPDFRPVFLKGNHDAWLLRFLDEPTAGPSWFFNGGDATLYSYGIGLEEAAVRPETQTERFARLRERLDAALPDHHRRFLDDLALCHTAGDYYFVHAGVRPGVALEAQSAQDQMWIRERFLEACEDFGKIVVHGHTPVTEVEIRPNRIGIDTGAYYSGVLTALVLEGEDRRLLQTGARHHG